MQETLPYCGPVPHMKVVDRPGLTEDSPPRPPLRPAAPPSAQQPPKPAAQKPQTPPKPAGWGPQFPPWPAIPKLQTPTKPAAQRPQYQPKPGAPKSAAVVPPSPPQSTPVFVPEEEDEEESDEEEEAPARLIRRTVSIVRGPSASCRTCPSTSCRAAERLGRRQITEVHCSTTPGSQSQFLRTASSCYVHGRDTDISLDEGMLIITCPRILTKLTFESNEITAMLLAR